MIQWFKSLFEQDDDPYDVLKSRSVQDFTLDELYELIDTTKPNNCRLAQFCLVIAEILRRTRK